MISRSNLLQVGLILMSSGIASAQSFPPPRQASDFNVEYQRAHAAETKDVRMWLEQIIVKYQKVQSPYL